MSSFVLNHLWFMRANASFSSFIFWKVFESFRCSFSCCLNSRLFLHGSHGRLLGSSCSPGLCMFKSFLYLTKCVCFFLDLLFYYSLQPTNQAFSRKLNHHFCDSRWPILTLTLFPSSFSSFPSHLFFFIPPLLFYLPLYSHFTLPFATIPLLPTPLCSLHLTFCHHSSSLTDPLLSSLLLSHHSFFLIVDNGLGNDCGYSSFSSRHQKGTHKS